MQRITTFPALAIVNSPYVLWVLLAAPSWPLVYDLFTDELYYPEMMYVSGVYSTQLLVLALCITPVTLLIKRWKWGQAVSRWLLARRRYFGVASFGYALLHVLHYITENNDLENVYLEAFDLEFAIGWLAFVILVPLVLTSNGASVRAMGPNWKKLQLLAYPAAAATFVHWWMFDFLPGRVLVWLVPLLVAKGIHVAYRLARRRPDAATQADAASSLPAPG